MTDQIPKENQAHDGDAVDQLENDFDGFFEFLMAEAGTDQKGGADGEKAQR